jgi:hypothetical protein
MKAVSGIIIGVFLGIVIICILIAVLVFYGPLKFDRNIVTEKTAAAAPFTKTPYSPAVETPPSPSASSVVTTPSPAAPAAPASSSPTTSVPQTSPAPEIKKTVDFSLQIIGVSGSGYSRRVSSRLANTGTADAHNTAVKVEAYYQGSKIKLGGQEYILQNLGIINAGISQTVETDLKFSIADGTKILKNGVDFVITITSDEKSTSLNYHYKP